MSIKIGDITLPIVTAFSPVKQSKILEDVLGNGINRPSTIAEFPSDLLTLRIDGGVMQVSGSPKSYSQYIEDIGALTSRFKEYCYIHDVLGWSGWMAPLRPEVSIQIFHDKVRTFILHGSFMPKSRYQCGIKLSSEVPLNDFNISDISNQLGMPTNAITLSQLSNSTRDSKDGTLKEYYNSESIEIKFDFTSSDSDNGGCKVWDTITPDNPDESTWIQIFSPDHTFSGNIVIENAYLRFYKIDTEFPEWYAFEEGEWTLIGTVSEYLTSDEVSTPYAISFRRVSSDQIEFLKISQSSTKTSSSICKINRTGGLRTKHLEGSFHSVKIENAFCDIAFGDGPYQINPLQGPYTDENTPSDNYMMAFNPEKDYGILISASTGKQSYVDTDDFGWINLSQGVYTLDTIPLSPTLYNSAPSMTLINAPELYELSVSPNAYMASDETYAIIQAEDTEGCGLTNILESGNYRLVARIKGAIGGLNTVKLEAYDIDGTIASTTEDSTDDFTWVSLDFTVDASKEVTMAITSVGEVLDIDTLLLIPLTLDSYQGIADQAHRAIADTRITRELIQR